MLSYKRAMEQSPVILTLKINNSQPVPLSAFVRAFTSLADEYKLAAYLNPNFDGDDAEVFIQQIRPGSIIADLIPYAGFALPIMASEAEKVFLAIEFVKTWEERFKALAKGLIPKNTSKGDLSRWAGSVEAIARDPLSSATLEAATFRDGKREVEATFTFSSSESKVIKEVIDGEFLRLEEKTSKDHKRVLMVFTRSDVGNAPLGKWSGERVLISEISDKSLAITYGSELAEQRIKHEIRNSDENIYKKGFNVDVKVQLNAIRPVAYSILEVHDVVDLPDD